METQTAGRRGNHQKTFFSRQKEGILVSFAIQLFTIPLVAYSYYEIPVYAMLINLFVLAVVNELLGLTVLGVIVGMRFACGACSVCALWLDARQLPVSV